MKKFIYVIITVLILSISLSVTSFAAGTEKNTESFYFATFSDDFRTMYYKGYEYHQKNLKHFDTYIAKDISIDSYEFDEAQASVFADSILSDTKYIGNVSYELSDSQKETVESVMIDGTDIIVYLTVNYKDGTAYSLDLLREDYTDDYNALSTGANDDYEIDFEWPEGNTVNTNKSKLTQNKSESISINQFDNFEYYLVYLHSEDRYLSYTAGVVLSDDDKYYFIDNAENNASAYVDIYEFMWMSSEKVVHEITDEELLAEIKAAEEEYYADEYGYLENDKLANTISYFFLVLLFGVIPGIAFIVSLIFAIIKKKTYRKLLFAVSFFTLAEIIVFIIFMIVANYK